MVTRTPTRKSSKMHRPGRAVGDLDAVILRFFFSEDAMSIRCFTVITRVLLNKPHISESLFFCPRSWNGFIKPKIGIPLVQIQPIRDPFVTHAHCEEIPGAAGPDALHFADRVADQLLVPWLLGKAPCLTEGYPYNGNSY